MKAIFGGFHLIEADESRIERTVGELKGMGVDEVYSGHCTGLRAECQFLRSYGRRFKKIYAGMKVRLAQR